MNEPLGVTILGATGSIGTSALAVMKEHVGRFRPVVLTAGRNLAGLRQLAEAYRPDLAVIADPLGNRLPQRNGTRWAAGRKAIVEAATHPGADIVLNALVGAAGLEPTLAALRAGKRVALANKESLVCGGALVAEAAKQGGGELIPVDSEHSAIFQCLTGCNGTEPRRLVLTASGGPFRSLSAQELSAVSPADALRHPTWEMGAKITIDSATLANKALEIIEAHFLFGVPYDRIEAVVHPQSIIHSMVEFVDGSLLAQMGLPNMEVPILYALSYPKRLPYSGERWDPVAAGSLTFEPIREDCFPAFRLGVAAGRKGGTAPAAFNAANEIAVAAFLEGRIGFPRIANAIEYALERCGDVSELSLENVIETDGQARRVTEHFLKASSW